MIGCVVTKKFFGEAGFYYGKNEGKARQYITKGHAINKIIKDGKKRCKTQRHS